MLVQSFLLFNDYINMFEAMPKMFEGVSKVYMSDAIGDYWIRR